MWVRFYIVNITFAWTMTSDDRSAATCCSNPRYHYLIEWIVFVSILYDCNSVYCEKIGADVLQINLLSAGRLEDQVRLKVIIKILLQKLHQLHTSNLPTEFCETLWKDGVYGNSCRKTLMKSVAKFVILGRNSFRLNHFSLILVV